MTDALESLPTDEIPIRANDQVYMDMLLKHETKSKLQTFFQHLKQPIVYGILFLLINTHTFRSLVESVLPYAQKTELSFLITKTAIFILVVFLYSTYSSST